MSRKIICATDFSPAADQAAQIALRLARLFRDRLELAHWVPRSPFIHPEMVATTLGPLREAASKALLARRAGLGSTDVEVVTRVEIGDAEDCLLEDGADPATRLLVLGTRRRTGVAGAFLGGVARRVARQAPCPVLVVPE